MKVVFCGPPHSGKSVFVINLLNRLPTDAYTIIRACPDGEGNWSNNKNQKETSIVRQKGQFSEKFVEDVCKRIDNQQNKIVLVDTGGLISKENEEIFKHCDSFVVLSNDKEQKENWIKFGQSLGLKCIASIDTSLDGKEEIYSRSPYLQGKMVGLTRGKEIKNSPIMDDLSSYIIEKSKYNGQIYRKENIIDDTELGFELGYGKHTLTENKTPTNKIEWDGDAVPKIYNYVKQKVNENQSIKINGVRANFILCAICKALKERGIKDIQTFDASTGSYIQIKDIPKKKVVKNSEGLKYYILENKENVFMDIDITKGKYSLNDYNQCILPQIDEKKNLYLSGKIPLWLLASISNSYDTNKIYTFQPGTGFTCISSSNKKDLGQVVDCVDGIDINQYFKDKKIKKDLEKTGNRVDEIDTEQHFKDRESKRNLPTVVKKQGFLSKIISAINNIRENISKQKSESKLESKYINSEIKAKVISQNNYENNDIMKELKVNTKEYTIPVNKNTITKSVEKSKDIGGE